MLQKILPIVLVFASYLCTAQEYKQMRKYFYEGDDSLNKKFRWEEHYNNLQKPVYAKSYWENSIWEYYYFYKDTFLVRMLCVGNNFRDSTEYTWNYTLDFKGRPSKVIETQATNYNADLKSALKYKGSRIDTITYAYRKNTQIKTCVRCTNERIKSYFDSNGRVLKEYGKTFIDTYDYTDTSTSIVCFYEWPYSGYNEQMYKYIYKRDSTGRMISETRHNQDGIYLDITYQYYPRKKIIKEIEYIPSKTTTYISIYE